MPVESQPNLPIRRQPDLGIEEAAADIQSIARRSGNPYGDIVGEEIVGKIGTAPEFPANLGTSHTIHQLPPEVPGEELQSGLSTRSS